MIDSSNSIALITPLKDELENIERFLRSIESQSVPIKCLVIVENDSADGSAEYLDKITSLKNVGIVKIIHLSFEDKTYRVGKKYATIITEGLMWLRKQDFYHTLEYIGILDSDIFPKPRYYEQLADFMGQHSEIGIASGIIFTPEGKLHMADSNWVRGGCRLWKRQCLDDAGYEVAYTADTVSVALAHLKGWKTRTLKSATVVSREVNIKLGSAKSKGYHAYYRGHTLFYMMLKMVHYSLKGNPRMGFERLSGYVQGMIQGKPRIENQEVRRYFRNYLFNKLTKKYQ